jgi:hypothetical protein
MSLELHTPTEMNAASAERRYNGKHLTYITFLEDALDQLSILDGISSFESEAHKVGIEADFSLEINIKYSDQGSRLCSFEKR